MYERLLSSLFGLVLACRQATHHLEALTTALARYRGGSLISHFAISRRMAVF